MALMYLSETPPGSHFTRVPRVGKTVGDWSYFENRTIVRGATGNTVNAIGLIQYLVFTADGISCVNWVQTAGIVDGRGVGTVLLTGYYCKGKGPVMGKGEARSIVKRIGHLKHGRIEPPN